MVSPVIKEGDAITCRYLLKIRQEIPPGTVQKSLHISAAGSLQFIRPSNNVVELNRSVQPQESNKRIIGSGSTSVKDVDALIEVPGVDKPCG